MKVCRLIKANDPMDERHIGNLYAITKERGDGSFSVKNLRTGKYNTLRINEIHIFDNEVESFEEAKLIFL